MIVWRPKDGPVFTWRRLLHLSIGFGIPWIAFRWGSYDVFGFTCWAVAILAGVWEIATVRLGERLRWTHRFGDVVDLVSVLAGVVIAGVTLR